MGKTELTRDIEDALYLYSLDKGEIVVEEVGMPDDLGIVDTLALRADYAGNHEWRCYEIKVSLADFRSKARLTFAGHYNYYVLPRFLYEKVKEEIPPHLGVLLYIPLEKPAEEEVAKGTLTIVKKASRQELLLDDTRLMHAFLHSLFREVKKAKRVEKGLFMHPSETLFKELKRRRQAGNYKSLNAENFYDRYLDEIEQEALEHLREELAATKAEYQNIKHQLGSQRRKTIPFLITEPAPSVPSSPETMTLTPQRPKYFPYYRGKQFDLIALREAALKNLIGPDTIPIIEPVRDSAHLRKTLEAFIKMEQPVILIQNPEVGQVQKGVPRLYPVDDLLASPYVTPAYLINENFQYQWVDVEDYVFISKHFAVDVLEEALGEFQPRYHLIGDSARLRRLVSDQAVLLTDPFTRLRHSADYLELPDEFFSDEASFCSDDGYAGYSDYGIDGEAYFDKGWPSRAVVLHILYLDPNLNVRIKHFCSDSNETAADPGGKFLEALQKLVAWYTQFAEKIPLTYGLTELMAYHHTLKYPGSGTIKKLSVLHQLETMKHLNEKLTPKES